VCIVSDIYETLSEQEIGIANPDPCLLNGSKFGFRYKRCCGSGSGRIRKFLQDPEPEAEPGKNHSESGSEQLKICHELEVKLL
jgi:hypothetical protein